MKNVSRHYRNDSSIGLQDKTRYYLDQEYLSNLQNLKNTNPKLLVVFSGGNAVGKTSLAQRIKEDLNAVVLENDAVKHILLKQNQNYSTDELNLMTWQYSMNLYSRLNKVTTNGLIVRDGIIDWYYDRILPIFESLGYSLFIVAFNISKDKSIELIHNRGDTTLLPEQKFYDLLDEHNFHIARFRAAYEPNIILGESDMFNYPLVINKIKVALKIAQQK